MSKEDRWAWTFLALWVAATAWVIVQAWCDTRALKVIALMFGGNPAL